jgi:hypothetical protein
MTEVTQTDRREVAQVLRHGELGGISDARTVDEFLSRRETDPLGTLTIDMLRPGWPEFHDLIRTRLGDTFSKLQGQHTVGRTRVEVTDIRETDTQINETYYGLIQSSLGLEDKTKAKQAFVKARAEAASATGDHAQLIGFDHRPTVQMTLDNTPADMLRAIFAGEDELAKFELQRQFVLTLIALQQDRLKVPLAPKKLKQIFDIIQTQVAGGSEPKKIPLYGMYGDETNELLGTITEEAPQYPALPGYHYKVIEEEHVYELPSGEKIVILVDEKKPSSAIRKTLRNGVSKGPQLEPEKIEDFHRMKILVLGNKTVERKVTDTLFDTLIRDDNAELFYNVNPDGTIMTDASGNPIGAYTGYGEVREGNKAGKGKKPVEYTKILMEFGGIPNPIEIVVQQYDEHRRNTDTVGFWDDVNQDYTGPAHAIFAIAREGDIQELLFPKSLYPKRDDKAFRRRMDATAEELRLANRYSQ